MFIFVFVFISFSANVFIANDNVCLFDREKKKQFYYIPMLQLKNNKILLFIS